MQEISKEAIIMFSIVGFIVIGLIISIFTTKVSILQRPDAMEEIYKVTWRNYE